MLPHICDTAKHTLSKLAVFVCLANSGSDLNDPISQIVYISGSKYYKLLLYPIIISTTNKNLFKSKTIFLC
jgi:hypothetical protein